MATARRIRISEEQDREIRRYLDKGVTAEEKKTLRKLSERMNHRLILSSSYCLLPCTAKRIALLSPFIRP